MFLCDLFEILTPINVKSELFLSQPIKSLHDTLDVCFKTLFELLVILIPSFNNLLVMFCIWDVYFWTHLIFLFFLLLLLHLLLLLIYFT